MLATLDLDAAVRELNVPAEIVVGTADRLTPPVHARALAAALPDCRGVTELPGVGHMTPVEEPDLVTTRIRDLVTAHVSASQPSVPAEESA